MRKISLVALGALLALGAATTARATSYWHGDATGHCHLVSTLGEIRPGFPLEGLLYTNYQTEQGYFDGFWGDDEDHFYWRGNAELYPDGRWYVTDGEWAWYNHNTEEYEAGGTWNGYFNESNGQAVGTWEGTWGMAAPCDGGWSAEKD